MFLSQMNFRLTFKYLAIGKMLVFLSGESSVKCFFSQIVLNRLGKLIPVLCCRLAANLELFGDIGVPKSSPFFGAT